MHLWQQKRNGFQSIWSWHWLHCDGIHIQSHSPLGICPAWWWFIVCLIWTKKKKEMKIWHLAAKINRIPVKMLILPWKVRTNSTMCSRRSMIRMCCTLSEMALWTCWLHPRTFQCGINDHEPLISSARYSFSEKRFVFVAFCIYLHWYLYQVRPSSWSSNSSKWR